MARDAIVRAAKRQRQVVFKLLVYVRKVNGYCELVGFEVARVAKCIKNHCQNACLRWETQVQAGSGEDPAKGVQNLLSSAQEMAQ